jgi:hypothetical protein
MSRDREPGGSTGVGLHPDLLWLLRCNTALSASVLISKMDSANLILQVNTTLMAGVLGKSPILALRS